MHPPNCHRRKACLFVALYLAGSWPDLFELFLVTVGCKHEATITAKALKVVFDAEGYIRSSNMDDCVANLAINALLTATCGTISRNATTARGVYAKPEPQGVAETNTRRDGHWQGAEKVPEISRGSV